MIDEYVKRMLRRIFKGNFRSLRRRKGEELSDGIIIVRDEVIVVEIKSGMLHLKTREDGDLVSFEHDVDKVIVRAAGQINTAIEAIRKEPRRLCGIAPGTEINFHPLIITADTFPMYGTLREFVEDRIAESGTLPARRTASPTVMRIEDVEFAKMYEALLAARAPPST